MGSPGQIVLMCDNDKRHHALLSEASSSSNRDMNCAWKIGPKKRIIFPIRVSVLFRSEDAHRPGLLLCPFKSLLSESLYFEATLS